MLGALKSKLVNCTTVKECQLFTSHFRIRSPQEGYLLKTDVGLTFLDMDTIVLEGRGLTRFVTDELNTFCIRANGLKVSDVIISLSDAEVVEMTGALNMIEVAYRVCNRNHKVHPITIAISIADIVHSVFSARYSHTFATALALYSADTNVLNQQWFEVLTDYGHDRAVLLATCGSYWVARGSISNYSRAAVGILKAAVEHHLLDEEIQWRVFDCVSRAPRIGADVKGAVELICDSINAHLTSLRVKSCGCFLILRYSQMSDMNRQIVLQTRAVEVCLRAGEAGSFHAKEVLLVLQN